MTKQEIAELRRVVSGHRFSGESVLRALDEREALLAAARALSAQIGECCGEYHDDALRKYLTAIEDAQK